MNPLHEMNSRFRSALAVAGFALLGLLVFSGGCARRAAESSTGAPAAGAKAKLVEPASATVVNVAEVVARDIRKTIEVTGSLAALQDVTVGPKQGARLAAVYPHEGETVRAGQIVAVLDNTDLQAQVQQAQANVDAAVTREQQARVALIQARNQLKNARTTLVWTEKTTASAIEVARSGVEQARERLAVVRSGARDQERRQAEEAVNAAKATLDKARADLRRYQALYREQVIPQSQLDQAQAAADTAQAQYNSAVQALSLVKEGARPEEIRQAEIAVQQARENLQRAEADRATINLRRQDVETAQVAIRSAEAGVEAARAGVQQARAALRIARDALDQSYIKSPITGIVAERRAEPGQALNPGAEVLRIVSPQSVYFQATLSESQYAEIRPGQSVRVTVDALPGKVFAGRVVSINPVASAAARSFSVRINITPDQRLRPQMFARGEILIDVHRNATLVPKDAVMMDADGGNPRVFVLERSDTARERKITAGYSDSNYVEALSGVRPGDRVITNGQTTLQTGDRVQVQ